LERPQTRTTSESSGSPRGVSKETVSDWRNRQYWEKSEGDGTMTIQLRTPKKKDQRAKQTILRFRRLVGGGVFEG